ncbi:MAG: TIGR02300 family protein [Hyphomonadaceae bacterium]|nr:TIGR02300 family protein [Hyphomonadaceae bacterium]
MGKQALGEKQVCPSCGAKFYDLGRRPAICPKCQTSFDPSDETLRLKRTRTRATVYEAEEEEEVRADDADDEAEEEVEEAAEIDAEAVEEPPVMTDEEEDEAAPVEGEIPPGFAEDDGELAEAGDDDEGVPLLEDEEEFPDEELGDLAEGEEEPDR